MSYFSLNKPDGQIDLNEVRRLTSNTSTAYTPDYQHGAIFLEPSLYSRPDISHEPSLYSRIDAPPLGLGVPTKRFVSDPLDVVSLGISWACAAAASSIISIPTIAYRLGYNNQLIVIGLLLSSQLICFKRIAPTVFSRIEERVGRSCLQNFDAIVRNSAMIDGTGIVWRVVIILLTILPIGLSAAYKGYAGGFATRRLDSTSCYYGLSGPGGLSTLGSHSGQSLMVNATIPFMAATYNLTDFLEDSELPRAYGFNTLLLSNTSTAVLDAPWSDTVDQLQSILGVDEKFTLRAQVYATVTRYNDLLDYHRDPNDTFWQEFPFDQGGWYLYANHCFNGRMIGYRSDFGGPPEPNGGNQSWVMMGVIPSWSDYTNPLPMNSPSFADFNSSAQLFYNTREVCQGTWTITRTSIDLSAGSCNGTQLDSQHQQIISNNTMDLTSWYMPLTTEYLCPYTADSTIESPWMLPTMTTFTATMIWSRMVGIRNTSGLLFSDQTYYRLDGDVLTHTVPVMQTPASLFVIVGMLPLLATLLFVIGLLCWRSPIGKGFGLVAILAGVETSGLEKLKGAEYSGKLREAVPLRLSVQTVDGTGAVVVGKGGGRSSKVAYHIE